ncbi:MAG TPA: hypothetical protein VMZ06_10580 [Candidatus Bathyarchaeia archaeon]|nr:hypothetical protein [Candidatus Bathyarchaeia archaeon]
MKMRRNVLGLCLIFVSCLAAADTITVGETTYTDVYVTQGATMYYVSNPEDGTILNVPLDQASGVDIIQDREARSGLYRRWQKKNAERRGLPEPAPVKAADPLGQSAAEPFEPGTPLKPIGKVEREYDAPAPSVSSSSNTNYNPVAYQQRMFEIQKNAQIAQLRQQREAQKMQRLRNVRVITSQDVAGRGMSGGMGGMGGYGGRRR